MKFISLYEIIDVRDGISGWKKMNSIDTLTTNNLTNTVENNPIQHNYVVWDYTFIISILKHIIFSRDGEILILYL